MEIKKVPLTGDELRIRNSVSIIIAIAMNPSNPSVGMQMWSNSDDHAKNNFVSPFNTVATIATNGGTKAQRADWLAQQANLAMKSQDLDELVSKYAAMIIAQHG